MTNFKGQTWTQYRKECKENNVEPVRADWLGITYTDEEINAQAMRFSARLQQRKEQARAMAATAGR